MRRLPILLSIALVFALLVVAAATAAAPDFCDEKDPKYNPNHPNCSTTTTVTPTTQPPQLEACETNMTIPGSGSTSFACLWTPVQDGAGAEEAWVTVSTEGKVKGLPVVSVRDDAPGDYCLLELEWADRTGLVYTSEKFALVYNNEEGFPPDYYDDWFGHSYWSHEYESMYVPGPPIKGAYWCGPQDPVLETIRFDTNGKPLHFEVYFNARGGGQVEIDLFPGQE